MYDALFEVDVVPHAIHVRRFKRGHEKIAVHDSRDVVVDDSPAPHAVCLGMKTQIGDCIKETLRTEVV
jgi:hypothetical protein